MCERVDEAWAMVYREQRVHGAGLMRQRNVLNDLTQGKHITIHASYLPIALQDYPLVWRITRAANLGQGMEDWMARSQSQF